MVERENISNENKNLLKKIITTSLGDLDYYESILKYLIFLLQENKNLNLISRKLDIKTIIYDHIYDSLLGYNFIKKHSSITDVGTGAGLPGILLGIIFPQKRINLVDKSPKKVLFLKKTVKLLCLNNVEVYERILNEYKIETNVLTCRAFKDINSILYMTKEFFNSGGIYILFKGKTNKINEEINSAERNFNLSIDIKRIEEIKEKERHMVIIKKSEGMLRNKRT